MSMGEADVNENFVNTVGVILSRLQRDVSGV